MSPRAARHTGVLAEWSDERGFGFVETGGRRTFVHISAFDPAGGRPQSGDFVQFEVGSAPDGRPCAVRASRVHALPGHATRRPPRRGAIDWAAFLPVLAVAAYLWLAVARLGAALWFPLAYLVLSVLAYLLYAADKRAAVAGTWRTPSGRSCWPRCSVAGRARSWPSRCCGTRTARRASSWRSGWPSRQT